MPEASDPLDKRLCRAELDAAADKYRYEGRLYPRVTNMLKGLGFIDDSFFTDAGRDRGTYVHQTIEWYLADTLEASALDPVLRGYLDAYRRFEDETGFRPWHSELALAEPVYGYGCRLDLFGPAKSELWVVDIKSGAVGWWVRYQLALQRRCLPHPEVERFALQLREDSTYKLIPFKAIEDLRTAVAIASTYHAREQRGGLDA